MDWADDRWHGHTGMDSTNEYCLIDEEHLKSSAENDPATQAAGD
jgi:hypothetical protein